MRESTFFQEILAEGRAEGRLEMGRAAVLEALTLRFGAEEAGQFIDRLNVIQDVEQLSALHRAAIRCRSIGGFRRALGTLRT